MTILSPAKVALLRSNFPALRKQVHGHPALFFDGPAGTQVPQPVIDAIAGYLINHNANHGGVFATSVESDHVLDEAHLAAADLFGTPDPGTVAFGANTTTLALSLSRALARTWRSGDEIVLSRLEHDANFTPWVLAAQDRGVTIRYIDVDPTDCTLRTEQYAQVLSERTKLVAVGCASNAVGTINPVKQICRWASDVGALSVLDAVHFAPHGLIDVVDWDCDFLLCSAYKFFGPHVGLMYGRRSLLESLTPYKLRPAPQDLPGRWMTGTQNHEGIAGTRAAIDYLASIGRDDEGAPENRRVALIEAFRSIRQYEHGLLVRLLGGLGKIPEVKVWGITEPDHLQQRLPTVSITHPAFRSRDLATRLAEEGVFVWHGNYYALPLTQAIGVEPDGMVRIGLCHYNTVEEVDRFLGILDRICVSASSATR